MKFDTPPPEPPTVVEVTFRLSSGEYPFVRISDEENCRFELLQILPRGDGRFAEFYSVLGGDPDRVLDRAREVDSVEADLLASEDGAGLFEFEVTEECPVADLATLETIPVDAASRDGTGRVEVEIIPPPEPSTVIEEFTDEYPDADVVEKTEAETPVPLFTHRELHQAVEERLTDRQREVLRVAYDRGYYERPREATGEDVAAELGVSVSTFTQHVRVAERNLLDILFEGDVV